MIKLFLAVLVSFTFNLEGSGFKEKYMLKNGCENIIKNNYKDSDANLVTGYILGYTKALITELEVYGLNISKSIELQQVCNRYLEVTTSMNIPDSEKHFPFLELTLDFELMILNNYDKFTIRDLREKYKND